MRLPIHAALAALLGTACFGGAAQAAEFATVVSSAPVGVSVPVHRCQTVSTYENRVAGHAVVCDCAEPAAKAGPPTARYYRTAPRPVYYEPAPPVVYVEPVVEVGFGFHGGHRGRH